MPVPASTTSGEAVSYLSSAVPASLVPSGTWWGGGGGKTGDGSTGWLPANGVVGFCGWAGCWACRTVWTTRLWRHGGSTTHGPFGPRVPTKCEVPTSSGLESSQMSLSVELRSLLAASS